MKDNRFHAQGSGLGEGNAELRRLGEKEPEQGRGEGVRKPKPEPYGDLEPQAQR